VVHLGNGVQIQSASILMSAEMFGRAVDRLLNTAFVVESVRAQFILEALMRDMPLLS